ncbi:MAG: LysE family translocator [Rubrivivax sp.]|nr:MAG: LysE family translocator [Rubrivivax sp.]
MIEITPGPNMAYLALLSARNGRLAGYVATAGIGLGLLTTGLLAAFGFGQLVQDTPWLYQTLRWAGVAYLFYLAWDCWRDVHRPTKTDIAQTYGAAFRRGLITNLLNPKAFVFYVTVLPSFAGGQSQLQSRVVLLTLIYVAIATLMHGLIAMGAGALTDVLQRPKWRVAMGAVSAALLVVVAIWVAVKT